MKRILLLCSFLLLGQAHLLYNATSSGDSKKIMFDLEDQNHVNRKMEIKSGITAATLKQEIAAKKIGPSAKPTDFELKMGGETLPDDTVLDESYDSKTINIKSLDQNYEITFETGKTIRTIITINGNPITSPYITNQLTQLFVDALDIPSGNALAKITVTTTPRSPEEALTPPYTLNNSEWRLKGSKNLRDFMINLRDIVHEALQETSKSRSSSSSSSSTRSTEEIKRSGSLDKEIHITTIAVKTLPIPSNSKPCVVKLNGRCVLESDQQTSLAGTLHTLFMLRNDRYIKEIEIESKGKSLLNSLKLMLDGREQKIKDKKALLSNLNDYISSLLKPDHEVTKLTIITDSNS